jgi:hypothetical protein
VSWLQALWAVDGNTLDAQLWRQQLYAATLKRSGIMAPGDLKVTAFGTPGAGVNIAGGTCVIAGQEVAGQGSYFGYNNGTDTVSVAATGGSPRTDLIVARVEDPTFAGSSWPWNPATQQLIYSRDLSSTSSLPAGVTAIPLALLTIPASTSAITNAMITDMRALANPAGLRNVAFQQAVALDSMVVGTDSKTSYRNWGPSFSIAVPWWAVNLLLDCNITVSAYDGASYGVGILARLSIAAGALFTTGIPVGDPGLPGSSASFQTRAIFGGQVNVVPYQNTTITVQPQAEIQNITNVQGHLDINTYSELVLDYTFLEAPQ